MTTDVNHIQTSNPIYCHRLRQVLKFTEKHFNEQCATDCPFFTGVAQGQGIECAFPIMSSKDDEVIVNITTKEEAQELAERAKASPDERAEPPAFSVPVAEPGVKYTVHKNGKELGWVMFGTELGAEITTQDSQLEEDFVQLLIMPVVVKDNQQGEIIASVGDVQFPEAAALALVKKGYQLNA